MYNSLYYLLAPCFMASAVFRLSKRTMRHRILTGVSGLAVAATMLLPMATMARGTEHPRLKSPVALDAKGDDHGIKAYNSERKNKKHRFVTGTVTAVSATSITVSVTKPADANTNTVASTTSYTFAIDSHTNYDRKFHGTANADEIQVGDTVQVWATSLTNGTAKLIWDKSIWWVDLKGTVSNLNTTTMAFTLTVKYLGQDVSTTVKYNATTKFMMGSTAKTAADLANGQTLRMRGSWHVVGSWLLAKKINIQS